MGKRARSDSGLASESIDTLRTRHVKQSHPATSVLPAPQESSAASAGREAPSAAHAAERDDQLFVIDAVPRPTRHAANRRVRTPGAKMFVMNEAEWATARAEHARKASQAKNGKGIAIASGVADGEPSSSSLPAPAPLRSRVAAAWDDDVNGKMPTPADKDNHNTDARKAVRSRRRIPAPAKPSVPSGAAHGWSVNPDTHAHAALVADASKAAARAADVRAADERAAARMSLEEYILTRTGDEEEAADGEAQVIATSTGQPLAQLRSRSKKRGGALADPALRLGPAAARPLSTRGFAHILPRTKDELPADGSLRAAPIAEPGALVEDIAHELTSRGLASRPAPPSRRRARAHPYTQVDFPRPATLVERYADDSRRALARAITAS